MQDQRFFEFGPFRLDATGKLLLRDGKVVALTPKVIDALLLLVENPGQVLSREELLRQLWPDTFVEEGNLTQNISVLRKALSGGTKSPTYIETIPKRGYRFVAEVRGCIGPDPASGHGGPPAARRGRMIRAAAAAVLLVAAGVLAGWYLWPPPPRAMMAVLPFENLSSDPQQEYFTAGLTEEMISVLGNLYPDRLGVIARTSVERYKQGGKAIDEIGRELGVSYVVEGSVRKEAGRLRIAAQLIQVSDQTHLWAATYEGDLGDLVRLQAEVAQAVAKEVHVKLSRQAQARVNRLKRSVNPDAYEAYLRGIYHFKPEYFQQAIELDPTYAPAYAGLARVLYYQGLGGVLPPGEAFSKLTEAAQKALDLDPELPQAWGLLALAKLHYEWDFPGAEKDFRRALDLNPSRAEVRHHFSHYLLWMDREEESVGESSRAMELDPLDPVLTACVGWHNLHAGHTDLAVEYARKALLQAPKFRVAMGFLGLALEQQGNIDEAIATFEELRGMSGGSASPNLAHALALAGRKHEAEEMLDQLLSQAQQQYVAPFGIAAVYTGLGDKGRALEWLQKSFEVRDAALIHVRWDPRFKPLHATPAFEDLVKRIGHRG